MSKPFEILDAGSRKKISRRPQPEWAEPMLATLARTPFSDPDWIFEPKLDGIRCLAYRSGRRVTLYSRNRLLLNGAYPEVVSALAGQVPPNFIVDGEIVALDGDVTRFSLLQQRKKVRTPVFYYVFDVLYLRNHDVTALPLVDRKALLQSEFSFDDPLRYVQHVESEGKAFFGEACGKGWEGIVAKRASAPYAHRRSTDWLKLKCENQQEFVIAGFTDPSGHRVGIGALLLGYYKDGALVYAGKVGTGFDNAMLGELRRKLSALEPAGPPSQTRHKTGMHWIKPRLVAQVAFTEWTRAGMLRHPRFLGLRTDKKPSEVVREVALAARRK